MKSILLKSVNPNFLVTQSLVLQTSDGQVVELDEGTYISIQSYQDFYVLSEVLKLTTTQLTKLMEYIKPVLVSAVIEVNKNDLLTDGYDLIPELLNTSNISEYCYSNNITNLLLINNL